MMVAIPAEKGEIMAQLITSIHGDTGGLQNYSSNCYRGIWSDIIKAGQSIEAAGFGLERSFRKSVGLGNTTRF